MASFSINPIARGVKSSTTDRRGGPLLDEIVSGAGINISAYDAGDGNIKTRVSAVNTGNAAYVATSDPTVDNDGVDSAEIGRSFEVGDYWLNVARKTQYVCFDNSANAAIWDFNHRTIYRGVSPGDLSGHKIVLNNLTYADSSDASHIGKVLGITFYASTGGDTVDIIINGILTEPTWNWTPGALLYLNGTTVSETPPTTGFLCLIGKALSAETVLISIDQPINLGA